MRAVLGGCNAAKPDGRQYPLSGRPVNRRFLLPGIYYRSNFGLLGHLQRILHLNGECQGSAQCSPAWYGQEGVALPEDFFVRR